MRIKSALEITAQENIVIQAGFDLEEDTLHTNKLKQEWLYRIWNIKHTDMP